jgi:hypothetical protein
MAPLHGAGSLIVTAQVSDEVAAEIDRLATANGQSRSAWMSHTLTRLVLAEVARIFRGCRLRRGHPDDAVRVTLRLHRREIEAIVAAGAQLWDRAGVLRLAPTTQSEIGKLRKQVFAIGRNINQAVHEMNAADLPGSALEIARIATPFIDTCGDLKALLFDVRRTLNSYVSGEVGYWTDAPERGGGMSFHLSAGTLDSIAWVFAPPGKRASRSGGGKGARCKRKGTMRPFDVHRPAAKPAAACKTVRQRQLKTRRKVGRRPAWSIDAQHLGGNDRRRRLISRIEPYRSISIYHFFN